MFLDELGDLDLSIQVKLLRVIETRTFHAVGESVAREFKGKLIAATHRDLSERIRDGAFREDLYYRLCSDQIVTPTLADQLYESPQVLNELVLYMSRRVAGPDALELLPMWPREVIVWIAGNLPGALRVAGQLSRAGAVREERPGPQGLQAFPALCRSSLWGFSCH